MGFIKISLSVVAGTVGGTVAGTVLGAYLAQNYSLPNIKTLATTGKLIKTHLNEATYRNPEAQEQKQTQEISHNDARQDN
ncbi:hypothetical protein CCACVL1_24676 [Corchorus capsularis]|uniref:Uncharacterized protein n=1 Tax=Corchorus capsularis TaxID=210143 RepID=A0A1R3GNG2_COCAP|nr:hypothetical protein CCACVL1_24676 [Corchorus capsularis]